MSKLNYIIIGFLLFSSMQALALQTIHIKPSADDMTPVVREALEGITDADVKLVFEKGTYKFLPNLAKEKYCYITNHNNGLKKIIFPFIDLNSVEIEGSGAEFIFHGQVMPFLFEECQKVTVNNLSIDWDIPFTFQGELVGYNKEQAWYDLQPFVDGFSWKVKKGELTFPNIDGFKFSKLGSALVFEPETKKVAHGAYDFYCTPNRVEEKDNGILRFHGTLKHYPKIGEVLHCKGPMDENRYAPAFQVISSKNIFIDSVMIHHALGMGFLFERSENATIMNSGVYVKDGSDRVVSIIADATHFCNCKGEILVENCRFENMLDDATNVHGTYVVIDEVLDANTLRFELKHFQQLGFEFAGVGDTLWFIQHPNMERAQENEVLKVRYINDRFSEITLKHALPKELKSGDLLENKTWNPIFTMRGCVMKNHRARNIVLKTPLKIVIEDNDLSSMMSSIFFRGESFFWYESGAVNDVVIRNNRFTHCAYSGSQHAVLYITPRFGKSFNQQSTFDKNIRFENNTIETFDSRIVWADRVDGLIIKDNVITKTDSAPALYPNAPVFDLKHCKNVELKNNSYAGNAKTMIKADETTQESIKIKSNKGF